MLVSMVLVASESDDSRLLVGPGRPRFLLQLALRGARQLLETDSCQQLLTDYADDGERSLKSRLESLNLPITSYFDSLWFVEADSRACGTYPGLVAHTRVKWTRRECLSAAVF